MADEVREPRGIVAIFTAPDGDVIATASDFSRSGMGGCTIWEAQVMRARQQVKFAAVRAYCSPVIADAMSSYLSEQTADALCQKGHKIRFAAVGYPDHVVAEVQRQR